MSGRQKRLWQMSLDVAYPIAFTSGEMVRRPDGARFQEFAPMVSLSYDTQQSAVEPTLLRVTPAQGNNRFAVRGELHRNGHPSHSGPSSEAVT